MANLALAKDQEQQQQQQQRQEQVQADLPGGHWDPGQGSTSSLVPESSANNLQKEGTRRSALQELLKRDRTPRCVLGRHTQIAHAGAFTHACTRI